MPYVIVLMDEKEDWGEEGRVDYKDIGDVIGPFDTEVEANAVANQLEADRPTWTHKSFFGHVSTGRVDFDWQVKELKSWENYWAN